MDEFVVASGDDLTAAFDLVERFHYSHRRPGAPRIVGAIKRDGQVVAACFFSNPPTRWSQPVMELSRLIRHPDLGLGVSLTELISKTRAAIKQRKDLPQILVSFADSTQDHHGGVYQAASWNYHEQRAPARDGFVIDGIFVPRRTCNARYGTSSKILIDALPLLGHTCEEHFDCGKHLYWVALDKSAKRAARDLNLKSIAYPKPLIAGDSE